MILHKQWGEHLRTGNWLFKYAGIIGLSEKFEVPFALPDHFMWQYFKDPPTIDNGLVAEVTLDQGGWGYDPQFWNNVKGLAQNQNVNIGLGNFFQDERNWLHCKKEVLRRMEWTDEAMDIAYLKMREIIPDDKYLGNQTIAISVRRGDFVGHGCFKQLNTDWYTSALISNFDDLDKMNVLFFSDDIEWCRNNFNFPRQYFAPVNNTHLTDKDNYHRDPMLQLIIGTLCDHFIISNSTFSWWMAYLGSAYHNAKVIRPNGYFDGDYKKQFDDSNYYPKSWIIHE